MSLPPIPPPLESLGSRPFSLYPPILNIEHNEWLYRRATWSEILMVNAKSGLEVWIPRRFVGDLSRIDEPVMILGLVKELEYKGGAVWPFQRRLIQMPVAVNDSPRSAAPVKTEPADVIGIRVESTESRMGRMVGAALLVGVLVCVVAVAVYRGGPPRPRISYTTRDQSYLELNQNDDYYSVVRKLGPPEQDRWRSETGEIQFRALFYPQRSYVVILMGSDRKGARYIGALDANWQPVHSIPFRSGGNTFPMLRGLKRF